MARPVSCSCMGKPVGGWGAQGSLEEGGSGEADVAGSGWGLALGEERRGRDWTRFLKKQDDSSVE